MFPSISSEEKRVLEALILQDEVLSVINKLPVNKSPILQEKRVLEAPILHD